MREVNQNADVAEDKLRISMDAKATVKVGPYSRGGYSWVTVEAADHDFQPETLLVPIGILLPKESELNIYMAFKRANADALVDAMDIFWTENKRRFPHITTLVADLDNGTENNSRRSQFIYRLIQFVDKHQINVELAYYPPYHSKYNAVEHCWGVLENHWNAGLLDSVQAVLKYASDMKWDGRHPAVQLLEGVYERGIRLGVKEMKELEKRLERDPKLPKYFVRISCRPPG